MVGCLTGSSSSGGLEVMLFLCPSQYRQEGAKRVPGIHRWALWSVIMGPIVPNCQLFIRDKQAGFSVPICPYISMCRPICVCVHLHSYAPINIINSFGFVKKLNILIVQQSSNNSKTATANLRIYIQVNNI